MLRTIGVALALGSLACSRSEPSDPPPAAPKAIVASTGDAKGEPKPTPVAAQPFARDDEAGVRKALAEATGRPVDDDACVAWPSSFPRVVVVGSFAHDRGCRVAGLFVDRDFHASDGEIAGLATRGFATAGLVDKESMARAWIDEVVHAFGGSFVTASVPAFEIEGSPEFEPVRVRANKIGGVVVEGWVQEPAGMQDESAFELVVYRLGPDGKVERESKRRFAVPGERLRAGR